MKLGPENIRPLAVPGAILIVVTALTIMVIASAEKLVEGRRQLRDTIERQRADVRQKHANAGAEKELITRYLGPYSALQDAGFIGGEQRVNWVDSLRTANREAHLFGVNYDIGQQEAYPLARDLGAGDLPLKQSPMKLTLPLLHEADLMAFFRSLAAQRSGMFMLNGCNLRRTGVTPPTGSQANLTAECEVAWITVDDTQAQATLRP